MTSLDINKNVTLAREKQHLKNASRTLSFNQGKHKNDTELSKEFQEI